MVFEHRKRKAVHLWQANTWQEQALAMVKDFTTREDANGVPLTRNILWVWSHQGMTGKTVFQQIVGQWFGDDFTRMRVTGEERMADMYDGQLVVGLDLPRAEYMTLERTPDGNLRGTVDLKQIVKLSTFLERLNDFGATIISARYQGARKQMRCRCVVVTSNMSPSEAGLHETLSMDRVHALDVGTWAENPAGTIPFRYDETGGGTAPNGGATPPLPTGAYQQFSASPIAEDVENAGAGGSE